MLLHFSVATNSGIEILTIEPNGNASKLYDRQLLSGFMTAFQLYSEEIGFPLREVHFENFILYIRSYGEFSLRLLLDERIEKKFIDSLFDRLAKEIYPLVSQKKNLLSSVIDDSLKERIFSLLDRTLIKKSAKLELDTATKRQMPIIAIIGLSQVGKTTIKRYFFDYLSREEASDSKATIGLDRSIKWLKFIRHSVVVYDFGGQVLYRNKFLVDKSLWEKIKIVIYVVDLQEPETFKEAKNYLDSICHLINQTGEGKIKLSIFFHKYDVDKRKELANNLKQAFSCFNDYHDKANFHLTTIQDNSCLLAMVKTIYFSIPTIILKRVLEEVFIDDFEFKLLPWITKKFTPEQIVKKSNEIHKIMIAFGKRCGYILQQNWIDYYTGLWTPKQRLLSAPSIDVDVKGNTVKIRIPRFRNDYYSKEIIDNLLEWSLEGLLKTLQMKPARKIAEDNYSTTWLMKI